MKFSQSLLFCAMTFDVFSSFIKRLHKTMTNYARICYSLLFGSILTNKQMRFFLMEVNFEVTTRELVPHIREEAPSSLISW